jgi:hypothetical protein
MQIIYASYTIPQSPSPNRSTTKQNSHFPSANSHFSRCEPAIEEKVGHERQDRSGFMEEETQLRHSSCRAGTITARKNEGIFRKAIA